MSGTHWANIIGAACGIVGGGTGIGGIVVAMLAKRDSGRAIKEAGRSADAAEKSAIAAAELNRIEQERRADEREQRHDDLGPQLLGEISPETRQGGATASLFGSITVTRSYRVQGEVLYRSGGKSTLDLSILRPHQPAEFEIEKWPTGSTRPMVESIKFRFWPPVEGDDVEVWTCPCQRPTGESLSGAGHWERTVLVTDYDLLESVW